MTEEKNIPALGEETVQAPDFIELEGLYTRLKKLGKDKFQYDSYTKVNYVTKIKTSSHYFNLDLPDEYKEYFISFEDAPLFWIMDSPVSWFLEETLKQKEKEGTKADVDPNKLMKEYYSKWVTSTRKSEKKYFAQSLFKTITKEKKSSLLSLIYGAVLFSFDEGMKNSETAQNYYDQAELAVDEIADEENIKLELKYLLKIYRGFDFFYSERIFEANEKFIEASVFKNDPLTAKYYQAVTEIMLNNKEGGFDLICDIYDYDVKKLGYAITNNNFVLFQYLIKNPVFLNVFNQRQFGIIFTLLEEYIKGKEFGSSENLAKLRSKFEHFKELHLNEYQDPGVRNNFAFIEKVLKGYFNSSLNIFFALSSILWIKLNDTLQLVFSSIRERFLAEIYDKLKVYDKNIAELNSLNEQLAKEIEEFKVKFKVATKSSVTYYEQQYEAQMSFLNRKLSQGMEEKNNNPVTAFKSSITYTFVFSVLVMLVTGFASYSSDYSDNVSGFGQIVKAILIAGGKWGAVTLIVGFFISVASAVYAVYERASEKQRIIKEISNLKYAKEKHLEKVIQDAEKSEKLTIRNLNERIEIHKKRIKEITEEKTAREIELHNQIEVKIKEETEKLTGLLERK